MAVEGDLAYIDYGEQPATVHARILAAHVDADLWVCITPDYDVYEEIISDRNMDAVSVTLGNGGLGSPLPPALHAPSVYNFRPMTAQDYQRLMGETRTYAAQLRVSLGLPPPGLVARAPGVGVGAAGSVEADTQLVWIALENDHGKNAGQIVCDVGQALPAGSVTLGINKALIPMGSGALAVKRIVKGKVNSIEARDLRVLPFQFDEQGTRRIEFATAVSRMTQDEMPGGALQLDGPPSTLGVLKGIVARGLTPVTDHEHWVRTNEFCRGDRSLYELEVITRCLEAFAMVDQINLPNSKGIELLMRRWQLIREAHRLSPQSPDYSAADVFMGWQYRREGINPEVAKFVASELKDQASIAKESRKAREEMQSRKGRGGGPGAKATAESK